MKTERTKSSEEGPSTASVLGGLALVGAAAGYALIAMRFRNFGATSRGAGSAEMRAAKAFSESESVRWTSRDAQRQTD